MPPSTGASLFRGVLALGGDFFDAACVECGKRIPDFDASDHQIGGDLNERDQNKGALQYARMGQGQVPIRDCDIAIGQDIDIDRAWPPMLGSLAPHLAFCFKTKIEQLVGAKISGDLEALIDEGWLIGAAKGGGKIKR